MKLKYGMNPYQGQAEIKNLGDDLEVLNGSPSMINFMDALNGWQLVKEVKEALEVPAATSFKHVTPSGVAIGKPLTDQERTAYFLDDMELSLLACAYARARSSDRLASFGDFIALSDKVDVTTALLIKKEVTDGIIAPDYDPEALEILKQKKKGGYVIFKINPGYTAPAVEKRELYGFELIQERNNLKIDASLLINVKTREKNIPAPIQKDLILGLITLKYTQSNSICSVYDGQVVGIGSGQQSRILCTELALGKANKWHQKLKNGAAGIPSDRKITRTEKDQLAEQVCRDQNKNEMKELKGLCLCSDGFFPQTDNIEVAYQSGVQFIAEPMGSIRDGDIISLCDEYGIALMDTGNRLFHH